MACMLCSTVQPVSQTCSNPTCSKSMASYFCPTCKFFDDDSSKGIFHCTACGICRVGGAHNFYHCNECHMCVAISTKGHTQHYERAFEANCPICGEWLHTSTNSSFQPEPCKHPIHSKCYRELIKQDNYSCPICSKTYSELLPFLQEAWKELKTKIDELPMPKEYENWTVEILCNDCNKKSICKFHVYGHACPTCQGFNTKITQNFKEEKQ
uniref:RING-type domain-containing protein n=1 Tax=Arcella intermedia TaxID=1963864 RepID=A0A6B2LEZ4_9EUKA